MVCCTEPLVVDASAVLSSRATGTAAALLTPLARLLLGPAAAALEGVEGVAPLLCPALRPLLPLLSACPERKHAVSWL